MERQDARDATREALGKSRRPHVRDAHAALEEHLVNLGVECSLDVRHAAGEDKSGAAGRRVLDFEAVARQPVAERGNVRVRGAEAPLEVRGREPPPEVGRRGVLLRGQEVLEGSLIPARQDEEDPLEAGVAVEARDVARRCHLPGNFTDCRKDVVRPGAKRRRREQEQAKNGRARRRPSGAAPAEEVDRPRHAGNRHDEEEPDGYHDEQGDERQEDRDEALQEGEDVLGKGEARVRDARRESRRRQARGAFHEMGDEGDRPAGSSGDDVEERRPFRLYGSDGDDRADDGPDERM